MGSTITVQIRVGQALDLVGPRLVIAQEGARRGSECDDDRAGAGAPRLASSWQKIYRGFTESFDTVNLWEVEALLDKLA